MKHPETICTGYARRLKIKGCSSNIKIIDFYSQIKTLYNNMNHTGIVCTIPFFQKLISNGNGYEAATCLCNTCQIRELS